MNEKEARRRGKRKRPRRRVEEKKKANEGKGCVGNGVLSHTVTRAVPSALVSLTAGFGMGPGVPSRL